MLAQARGASRALDASRSFLRDLLGDYHPRDFAVRFWDGSTWGPDPGQPARFTLVLRHPGALRRMLLPPSELALGEAYIYDDVDFEGEIDAVFPLGDRLMSGQGAGVGGRLRQGRQALQLLRLPSDGRARQGRQAAQLEGDRHSVERDRAAVTYHYDVSNDFYALWLDRRMVYSCAYFASRDEDLDSAQERKLDYICRKLRLRPGERLLDIGCGWGGLVMHAAQRYGVSAVGITLSQPQADLANARIRDAGLGDRCRVEARDYRQVDDPEGYDKLVSVGMFEHVGQGLLATYMARAWRLLRPGGVFLNHGIAAVPSYPPPRGPSFMERYVFPDGELVPISTTLMAAELCGFEVRDVESLREHYALTLRRWVSRLEAHHDEARQVAGEVAYRIWRLFMAACAYSFDRGRINVYQVLLARPRDGASGLPLTRGDWYAT